MYILASRGLPLVRVILDCFAYRYRRAPGFLGRTRHRYTRMATFSKRRQRAITTEQTTAESSESSMATTGANFVSSRAQGAALWDVWRHGNKLKGRLHAARKVLFYIRIELAAVPRCKIRCSMNFITCCSGSSNESKNSCKRGMIPTSTAYWRTLPHGPRAHRGPSPSGGGEEKRILSMMMVAPSISLGSATVGTES